jgi:NitT/TauT family transport system substrate-binding protein
MRPPTRPYRPTAFRARRRRRLSRLVVALLAAAMTLTACGSDSGGSGDKLTLVLPNSSIIPFYEAYVARENGYFKNEGLTVEINSQDGSEPTVQALASGQADLIELTTSALLPAAAARGGFDPKLFFLTESKAPFDVVAKSGSGVTTGAGMKGKTLGVGTPDGAETITAKGLLGAAGLVPGKDYKILPVGAGGQAVAALERGDIDAYAGGIADLAVLRARGIGLTSLTPPGAPGQVGFGYWALDKTVTKNRAELEKFSRAIERAHEYINGDPQKLVDFTKKANPQQVKDPKVALELAKAAVELRSPESGQRFGTVVPDRWQAWYASLVSTGAIAKNKAEDPSAFYTNDLVAGA